MKALEKTFEKINECFSQGDHEGREPVTRASILAAAQVCVCGQREEEWRFIPGFSKHYMVSNFGRVKSLKRIIERRNGRKQTIKERILLQYPDEWGYPQVGINKTTVKVHRLVALAFLGERKEKDVIRHKDGNPQNCALWNLEYGTASQNMLDCYRYRGNLRKGQKLSVKSAEEIKEKIKDGDRGVDIAKKYGVSQQTICDIKHGRIYKHIEETA